MVNTPGKEVQVCSWAKCTVGMEFCPGWGEWSRWDLARVMCNLQGDLHLSRTDQERSKRSHSGYRLPCSRKEHSKTRKTRRLMFTESLTATRCSTLFISSYFTLSRFLEVGTIIIPLYKWRLREVTWALATQLVKNRSRAQAWVLCTCHKILTSILHFFMVVAKKKVGARLLDWQCEELKEPSFQQNSYLRKF